MSIAFFPCWRPSSTLATVCHFDPHRSTIRWRGQAISPPPTVRERDRLLGNSSIAKHVASLLGLKAGGIMARPARLQAQAPPRPQLQPPIAGQVAPVHVDPVADRDAVAAGEGEDAGHIRPEVSGRRALVVCAASGSMGEGLRTMRSGRPRLGLAARGHRIAGASGRGAPCRLTLSATGEPVWRAQCTRTGRDRLARQVHAAIRQPANRCCLGIRSNLRAPVLWWLPPWGQRQRFPENRSVSLASV